MKRFIQIFILLLILVINIFSVQESTSLNANNIIRQSVENGKLLFVQGDFKEAEKAFQAGLDQARLSNNRKNILESLMHLGAVEWNLGNIKTSAEYYSEALYLADELVYPDYQKKCREILDIYPLYDKGKNCRDRGEAKESIKSFGRAIKIAQAVMSREHELKCLRQISISYWDLNELVMFLKLNENALDLSRSLNHKREEGRCLNHLGLYFWKTTDYSKALSYYMEALAIARKRMDNKEISSCLNNIGLIYKEIGYYDQALSCLNQALDIDRQLGINKLISIDLNNLGSTYIRKSTVTGKSETLLQALNCYEECLRLAQKDQDRRTEVQVLNNIGTVYMDLGNYSRAKENLLLAQSKGRKVNDIEATGMILNNIGSVYLHQKDLQTAVIYLRKAIAIGERIQSNNILWEAMWQLGQCFEFMGRDRDAMDMYKDAINIIDHIRSRMLLDTYKTGYIQHKLEVYESLIDLTFNMYENNQEQEWAQKIFHFVERAKARSFLDMIAASKIDLFERMDSNSRDKEAGLSLHISSIQKSLFMPGLNSQQREELKDQLIQAENEYMQWLSRIRIRNPEVANLVSPELCRPLDLQSQILDKKTAVFEYYLGINRSYLFVITSDRYQLFALPARKKIQESLRAYLKMLSDPPESEFKGIKASKRLFKEFLFPLEENELSDLDQLIVIPDGILYYLPFETLIMNSKGSDESKKMLIHQFKISYAPSASSLYYLLKTKKKVRQAKTLLAFGSPFYKLDAGAGGKENKDASEILRDLYMSSGFDFSPLKYGKKEVQWIAKKFPGVMTKVCVGKDAKEQVVKSLKPDEYQILHFACHSLLDEVLPYRSALVLSLENLDKEDGFLQVREIYNLRLSSDLIVLSGCQTGRGKMTRGEGILGLPRIFFYAGARSVVSSVWNIADKPTALFMKEFYHHLSRGKDKNQALRLAKLKMIHSRYSHPFFWAAFVLYGDSSAIHFKPDN